MSDPARPAEPLRSGGWAPRRLPLDRPELLLAVERVQYGDADVATLPYYDWMYRRNPAGEAVVWYGDTGDPACPSAGHFILVPKRFCVRGVEVIGGLGANVVVHPEWRRRGVLGGVTAKVLEDARERGIHFSYGLPAKEANAVFTGKIGYREIGRVPLLLAPLDGSTLALADADLLRRLVVRLAAPLASAASRVVRATARAGRARVEEVPADWAGFDALWARLRGKRAVMGVRDRTHLAWRFGACPTRSYRLYVAHAGGAARGLLVTRVATVVGQRAGLVVDLCAELGDAGRDACASLAAAAVAEFVRAGVPLAACLVSRGSDEYRALRRAGFFPCPRAFEPQPFPVIVNWHEPRRDPEVPDRIDEWFVTQGDYDAV